jgi:hypothetical protein
MDTILAEHMGTITALETLTLTEIMEAQGTLTLTETMENQEDPV